jgi:putative acetyltransferase
LISGLIVRDEVAADHPVITDLVRVAFAPMPFSDENDHLITDALRSAGDLTLSLVAEVQGELIGHVAFSPVVIGPLSGWFGLGPLAVRADWQRKGVGRALVATGLRRLTDMGASGCALIGNPAIYGRLGFHSDGRLSFGGLPPHLVQWQALRAGPPPEGAIRFAPAFGPATDADTV